MGNGKEFQRGFGKKKKKKRGKKGPLREICAKMASFAFMEQIIETLQNDFPCKAAR